MVILIADDDSSVRSSLSRLMQPHHEVFVCENGEEALKKLQETQIDVVFTDHQMPKVSGLDVIRQGKEFSPTTSFLLMTAFGSVNQAVEAIRLGADDYFMKPCDLSEIEHRLQRVEELRSWKAEKALKVESSAGTRRLIGESQALKNVQALIPKVASVPSPVLILGPSGSGKEVVAKAIHETGNRASRPFIAINCASLSEQLMESELFGHEKGAFTGANASKPGKFELAKGGTIFLDEIGELSQGIQAKLLRVLQEKEFFRVGGVKHIRSDVRILAATHRPLKEMVKQGAFREDLFFRLNVVSLELPPLSVRQDDIPLLIKFFWAKLNRDFNRTLQLAPTTLEALCRYSYPGNVRELQNALERLVVLGGETGTLGPELLPPEFHAANSISSPSMDLSKGLPDLADDFELSVIEKAMAQCNQNQVKAAELLKISRGTLQYKMKRLGYHTPEAPDSEAA